MPGTAISQTATPSRGTSRKQSLAVFGTVLAVAASFSWPFLARELWHDEVYTLTHFVNQGYRHIFTDYHLPNNHILFSAALRGWSLLSASLHLPGWSLRLLPWACSLGAVAFLFLAVRKWRGTRAAFWSALLLGTSHAWLNFSCQLRGYALSSLLSSAGLAVTAILISRPRTIANIGFAVLAFLAVGTIPSNLLLFLTLALWLFLEAFRMRDSSRPRIVTLAVSAFSPFAGLFWYLTHPVVRRQFLEHLSGGRAGAQAFSPVIHEIGFALFSDIACLAPLMLLGFLLSLRFREKESGPSDLWPFALAVAVPLLSSCLVRLYPRNFLPFFPLWFALLGISLDTLLGRLGEKSKRLRLIGPGLAALVILTAAWRELIFTENFLRQFSGTQPQTLYYQYYQVSYSPSRVVKFLARHSPAIAFADDADIVSLNFHARLVGFKGFYYSGHRPYTRVFRQAIQRGQAPFFVTISEPEAAHMLKTLGWPGMPPLHLQKVQDTGFFKVFQVIHTP